MLEIFLALALLLHCLLAWQHYQRAVLLTIVVIPAYLLRLTIFGIPTNYFELSVLALGGVGLGQAAIRAQWLAQWHIIPRPVVILSIVFLFANGIAVAVSGETQVSLGILKSWIIVPFLFAALTVATCTTRAQQRRILPTLLLSGVFIALICLLYFSWGVRLSGIYDVPNSLALWLAPLFVAAVWLVPRSWGYAIATLILGIALLATQSIGAIMASVAALGIGALRWRQADNRRKWLLFLGILILGSALYFSASGRLTYLLQPWQQGAPNSVSVRLQLWSIGLELIRDHPLAGIGLGQFEPAYQKKLHERFAAATKPLPEFVFRDPHNWLLSFWLNTGLVGFISFVGLQSYVLYRSFRFSEDTFLQASVLALTTLLIFGLVDTIFWKNDLAAVHVLLILIIIRGWEKAR